MAQQVQTWDVTDAEAGQKLLAFLERRLGRGVPRSALMRWIRTGQVRVDGGRCGPFDRLQAGARVRVPPFAPGADLQTPPPADLPPLEAVFEDADLVVLSKPAGLPTQPGTGWTDSVQARLRARYPDADFAPTPAHRLDRDATGLLLAGKTYTCLAWLHELFRSGGVGKTYLAWVAGDWPWEGSTPLRDRMEKEGAPGRERVAVGRGKTALAEARVLVRTKGASLMEVRLLTGRTHQIRAQLASRGHPIVGDRKYGGPACGQGMLLHAWILTLPDASFRLDPAWSGEWAVPAGLAAPAP